MSKVLLLLVCLSALTTSFAGSFFEKASSAMTRDLPLSKAYYARNGVNRIFSDGTNFYVGADLKYDYSIDTSDSDFGTDTVPMQLNLYTNSTWLMLSCLGYSQYSCSYYSCTEEKEHPRFQNLLAFNAQGYQASANVYMDYWNWRADEDVYLATSCSSNSSNYQQYGLYGMIGLGRGGSASNNYDYTYPVFSVSLYQNLSGGNLVFTSSSYSDSNTLTFSADENWVINPSGSYVYLYAGDYQYGLSIGYPKLIFDLNSNAIGLPLSAYYTFISYIAVYMGLSCDTSTSFPTCYYSGYVSSLMDIGIYVDYNLIRIPPQVYVQDYDTLTNTYVSSVTLNIKGLASNLTGDSYVTATYKDYIVLNYHFMSYYTVQFDASSTYPQVSIYIPPVPSPSPSSNGAPSSLWIILLSVGAVFLFISLICCCCRNKNKTRHNTSSNVNPTALSQQDPLILNEENVPVYSQYPPGPGNNGQLYPQYPYYLPPTGTQPAVDANNYQQHQQQAAFPQFTAHTGDPAQPKYYVSN